MEEDTVDICCLTPYPDPKGAVVERTHESEHPRSGMFPKPSGGREESQVGDVAADL